MNGYALKPHRDVGWGYNSYENDSLYKILEVKWFETMLQPLNVETTFTITTILQTSTITKTNF